MTVVNNIRKYAEYLRTKRALETLPRDVALDLDIQRMDAARLARQAVYGN